jgi:soluble lytic murein transglycosylase-like protein
LTLRATLFATASLIIAFGPGPAAAAPMEAISATDARYYSAAFAAVERGDPSTAETLLSKVHDPCLVGRVRYLQLIQGPASHATYGELARWLSAFMDLPGAERIYQLALRLRPPGEQPPAPITRLGGGTPSAGDPLVASHPSAVARQAYFDGDLARAVEIAAASHDLWIAGLASYRLGQFESAIRFFATVANDPTLDDEARAAGAFWAARSAMGAGHNEHTEAFLRAAASLPSTFYGMIAHRRLEMAGELAGQRANRAETKGKASDAPPAGQVAQLVRNDPRARRAVALMQVGRPGEAGLEMQTGRALALNEVEKSAWTALIGLFNPRASGPASSELNLHPPAPSYPTPNLEPIGGFTLNKALVYALAWQESHFNPSAVSSAGAVGLMQLRPGTARQVSEDGRGATRSALFNPSVNLKAGQDYVRWLMDHAVGPDLLRAVAAYNGGPNLLSRTQAAVSADDSLLIVESLPYPETRQYVRSVMTAYWAYRRQFGGENKTLDALAAGQGFVDARLDR